MLVSPAVARRATQCPDSQTKSCGPRFDMMTIVSPAAFVHGPVEFIVAGASHARQNANARFRSSTRFAAAFRCAHLVLAHLPCSRRPSPSFARRKLALLPLPRQSTPQHEARCPTWQCDARDRALFFTTPCVRLQLAR